MREIVVSTIAKHHIVAAVAYQTVIGQQAVRKNSSIIGIVNNTLVQYQFWICINGRLFGNNGLVCIFYKGKGHYVILAVAPEINAGPACRQVFIYIIQPVAGKNHIICFGWISLLKCHLQ